MVVHVGRAPEQRVAEGTDVASVGSDVFLRWVVLAVVHVELFQRRKLRVAHTTGEGRFPILKKNTEMIENKGKNQYYYKKIKIKCL